MKWKAKKAKDRCKKKALILVQELMPFKHRNRLLVI